MQTYHVAGVRAVVAPRIGVAAHVGRLFVEAQKGRAVGVAAASGAFGEVAVAYRCRRRQGSGAAARVRGKAKHESNGKRTLTMDPVKKAIKLYACLGKVWLIVHSRG